MSEDPVSERRPIVGGNWKMHMLSAEAAAYCEALLSGADSPATDVVIFPPYTLLAQVATHLAGSWAACGGQDLHTETAGAHTGDISGLQLVDAGCTWVLCGHSERRRDHAETDDLVGRRVEAATAAGLIPMVCVGETAEERRAERTFEVLERQLCAALASRPDRFALAYEPVWAIGTGDTATPDIAQEAHRFLRDGMADLIGADVSQRKRILYGGSVGPENAADLATREDIDGFLVGGASLDPGKFLNIMRCWG